MSMNNELLPFHPAVVIGVRDSSYRTDENGIEMNKHAVRKWYNCEGRVLHTCLGSTVSCAASTIKSEHCIHKKGVMNYLEEVRDSAE